MYKGKAHSEEIIKCCNDLLAFEHVAIGGYKSAIEGCAEEAPDVSAKLSEFLQDHYRHVKELEGHVRSCGGEPRTTPGAQVIFKKPIMEIKKMLGVESILSGMVSNEESAVTTYEDALADVKKRFSSFPELIETCRRALSDEQRHVAYCRDQYARCKELARSKSEGFSTMKPTTPPHVREPRKEERGGLAGKA